MQSALTLKVRDTLVVASDGLYDNLSTDAIVETLRRGPLEAAVDTLVAETRARMEGGGKPDDLTLVAFRPARSHPA
jgi:serine/threonine protein phosphatase PrpC